jgi:hypothetical protein
LLLRLNQTHAQLADDLARSRREDVMLHRLVADVVRRQRRGRHSPRHLMP